MRIGLDLDNTLIAYDTLFRSLAVEQGLLPPGLAANKQAVREALRARPTGETLWRALQAQVYGSRIMEAELFPGVREFLTRGAALGVPLFVVSHKTRFPAAGGPDLHRAALDFLTAQGLLPPASGALLPERIFFEATRQAKCARIRSLGCTHFVDDLPEVLTAPEFPQGVRRYLFAPGGAPPLEGAVVVRGMGELSGLLFGPVGEG